MASLTPNLKLILEDSLSSTARSNLLKIDTLGGLMNVDTTATVQIRSARNIVLVPNSPDVGGVGSGGSIQFGRAGQPLSEFSVFTETFSTSSITLEDQTENSTGALLLKYESGEVHDQERILTLDLEGSDRIFRLGGDLTTTGGALNLTLQADSNLTLPSSGTLATLAGTETLLNKTFAELKLTGNSHTATLSAPTLTETYALELPATPGLPGQILARTGAYGLEWLTVNVSQNGGELASVWTPALGGTVNIAHSLNSRQLLVQVLDTADDYATIEVTVKRLSDSVVQLSSTTTPPNNWLVLIKEII